MVEKQRVHCGGWAWGGCGCGTQKGPPVPVSSVLPRSTCRTQHWPEGL